MRQRLYYITMLIGLFVLVCIRVVADDATPPQPPAISDGQPGVLLLQDGGILEGQITHAVDWYLVVRGGGQMQIAASRVRFVGRTLHEAYEHLRQHSARPTGESRLALAEWCLRYNLVDEASAELETAKSLGAGQARAQLVERRIAATRTRLTAKPTVTPAAHSQTVVVEAPAPRPAVARDLPDGALELFTRKVQPILVNNCTAAKCHQPGGQQSFQLNRAVLRGEANRQTTTQNLYAALSLVDRERPEASPLLTLPRRTHGGMNGPILGARQEKALKHLADWVALVAPAKTVDSAPANVPAEGETNATSSSSAPAGGWSAGDGQVVASPGVKPAVATQDEPIESLRSPRRLQYGETPKPWQPRDPFDPEIFNRRQRGTGSQ